MLSRGSFLMRLWFNNSSIYVIKLNNEWRMLMFYIFLFLITASVIGEAVFKIRKKRKITKYALAKITIPLVLLVLCIVDMFFLLFGGSLFALWLLDDFRPGQIFVRWRSPHTE